MVVLAWVVGLSALLAVIAVLRDPFLLVRLEFARQRRAAGLAHGTVDAAGHRWAYAWRQAETADAPVLVMLHGFTGSKENWYPLARALGGRYHLLIPDLPGWGDSQRRPDVAYGFVEQAAHVAAFIDALSPGRPVLLLGHSMGGGIAALVAARHRERIGKVALISAAGVRFADNAFGLAVLAGDNPFAVQDAASLRRYLDTVFFDAATKPWIPWPASAALIARRRRDAGFEHAVLELIGRSADSLRPGLEAADIHQPALLVWGRQDAVIDPSALALYAAAMPQAQTCLVEGCGHMVMMENPAAVAAAVVKWASPT